MRALWLAAVLALLVTGYGYFFDAPPRQDVAAISD